MEENELLSALADMVNQHCSVPDSANLDSCALSANAYAMRILAKHGKLKILNEYGRRVIGKFIVE